MFTKYLFVFINLTNQRGTVISLTIIYLVYQDLRRKRNDVTIELRKTLRDEQLKKHRNIVLDAHDDELEIKPEVDLTIDDIKEGELKFLIY